MRRVSRKKQDVLSSREEAKAPPVVPGTVRRQQPPQEVLQQRKKQQDELTSLTTKNYRLAKELVRFTAIKLNAIFISLRRLPIVEFYILLPKRTQTIMPDFAFFSLFLNSNQILTFS